jgi:hypothetical protein
VIGHRCLWKYSKKLRKEVTAVMRPDNWLGGDDGAINGGVVEARAFNASAAVIPQYSDIAVLISAALH